jgi:hypothetical protein
MAQDQGGGVGDEAPENADRVLSGLREVIAAGIVESPKKTILACLLIRTIQRPEMKRQLGDSIRRPRRWGAALAITFSAAGLGCDLHAWAWLAAHILRLLSARPWRPGTVRVDASAPRGDDTVQIVGAGLWWASRRCLSSSGFSPWECHRPRRETRISFARPGHIDTCA